MSRAPGKAFMSKGVALSVALAVLVVAAIASALTLGHDTLVLASNDSECLLGTYTVERSTSVTNPVTGVRQGVLVSVMLNITKVKEGEFLVTASTALTPQGSGKVTIMFTPPLTDMVVSTDTGTFRWSQGKYFIQAIISKDLPTTSKIEMKVKGSCVKSVIVEVRPLKTTVAFGSGYPAEAPPQNTQSVKEGVAGYVVVVSRNGSLRVFELKKSSKGSVLEGYVARNVTIPCSVVIGGIPVSNVILKVYVPRNLSEEQLKAALQPLLAVCRGNLSGLRGIAIVSAEGFKEMLKGVYASAEVQHASGTTTVTVTKVATTVAATITATVTTTSTTRVYGTSTPTSSYPTVPTTTAPMQAVPRTGTSPSMETAATPLPLVTVPKAVAVATALGIALIVGAVVYLIVIRRV